MQEPKLDAVRFPFTGHLELTYVNDNAIFAVTIVSRDGDSIRLLMYPEVYKSLSEWLYRRERKGAVPQDIQDAEKEDSFTDSSHMYQQDCDAELRDKKKRFADMAYSILTASIANGKSASDLAVIHDAIICVDVMEARLQQFFEDAADFKKMAY